MAAGPAPESKERSRFVKSGRLSEGLAETATELWSTATIACDVAAGLYLDAIVLQDWSACGILEVMPLDVPEVAAEVGIPVIHPGAPYQRQHSALVVRQRALQRLCRARAEEHVEVQRAAVVHSPCLQSRALDVGQWETCIAPCVTLHSG